MYTLDNDINQFVIYDTIKLSPKEYLNFLIDNHNRRSIKSVTFIPPQIGKREFGSFRLQLKHGLKPVK